MSKIKKLISGLGVVAILMCGSLITSAAAVTGSAGWQQAGDEWRYMTPEGSYVTGAWVKDADGRWYAFDENGVMRTGWYTDPAGVVYYLNPVSDGHRGAMVTGWVHEADGRWYFMNYTGAMQKGLHEVNYNMYYFNLDDGALFQGVKNINGRDFTFTEWGTGDTRPAARVGAVWDSFGNPLSIAEGDESQALTMDDYVQKAVDRVDAGMYVEQASKSGRTITVTGNDTTLAEALSGMQSIYNTFKSETEHLGPVQIKISGNVETDYPIRGSADLLLFARAEGYKGVTKSSEVTGTYTVDIIYSSGTAAYTVVMN